MENNNTTTKVRLKNRMNKLGQLVKTNKDDVEMIYNKIEELFPHSCEVYVYDDEPNNIYFLACEEYTGKKPTKKEMKEIDSEFYCIDRLGGVVVDITIQDDKIELSAHVGVEYSDRWFNTDSTTYTICEFEIEL